MLHLGRTVRLVWRIAPGWTAANIALAVIQGLLPLATLYVTKLILDSVQKGIDAADKPAAFRDVAFLIVVAGLVGLVAALARSVSTLVGEAQGQVVTDHISDIIHAKSIEVDLEYYENSRYYDVLHRAQQEAPYRPTKIVNDLVSIGQSLISLAAVLVLLFALSWAVGLIILAAALPGAYFRMRYSSKLYEWERRRTGADRRSWYLHWLLTDGSRAKEIRLFELGHTFRRWFSELRRDLRRERLAIVTKRSAADFASGAAAVAAIFGTFAYIARRTIQGTLTIGAMTMYYLAFQVGLSALQQVLGGLAGLYEDNLFLTYFHEFETLERSIDDPPDPQPVPRPMQTGIAFEEVSFSYPDTERTAIDRVSLVVRPGEVAALVGPNGSGKTTLIKHLNALLFPAAGTVCVDGMMTTDASSVREIRRRVGMVFQNPESQIVGMTVEEDVAFGPENLALPSAEIRRRVDACLAMVGMKGFEKRAPHTLSGGEKRLLSIAGVVAMNPSYIAFDEPTAYLDPAGKQRVLEIIRRLNREGMAIIHIAHDMRDVAEADRVVVMDRGRLLLTGTPAEVFGQAERLTAIGLDGLPGEGGR